MANFPVSGASEVISKVVSNVIPPRTYTYLFAMIPGLFFEVSILFGNPGYVLQLVQKSRAGVALDRYMLVSIALFLAFVIGNGFMLFVGLIQRLLGLVHRVRVFSWRQFCKWPLAPFMNWIRKKPFWSKRPWVHEFSNHVIEKASPGGTDVPTALRKCWAMSARPVLETVYKIKPAELDQEEWDALYGNLGTLKPAEVRGSVFMIASEATGWCGLAASLFAPALRNRYYLGFAVILVFAGILHDWNLARRLGDWTAWGVLELRAIMRESKKTSQLVQHDKRPPRSTDST
jgi:hypothetical protein